MVSPGRSRARQVPEMAPMPGENRAAASVLSHAEILSSTISELGLFTRV